MTRIRLTRRERLLLAAILEGRTNKQIASQAALSDQTVRNRLAGLYRKFGVHSRLQLAVEVMNRRVRPTRED